MIKQGQYIFLITGYINRCKSVNRSLAQSHILLKLHEKKYFFSGFFIYHCIRLDLMNFDLSVYKLFLPVTMGIEQSNER